MSFYHALIEWFNKFKIYLSLTITTLSITLKGTF